ncbi:S41 family peptidase [Niameybacter massiliensis]|uniref:S41 family peptidase n=1 Tax=Niameybacter massiliensis TaxID=1658108 RepID=UPI0006B678C0|nr:S41 family peptidase [Niameybacter massiliensis]
MKRRFVIGIVAGVLVGVAGVGTLYGIGHLNSAAGESGSSSILSGSFYNKAKANALKQVVQAKYIGEGLDEDMLEGIYRGYVYGVGDTYTSYLSEEAFNKEQTEAEGNYLGTGIRFTWGITNQYLIVTEVIPNSPAEQAGIIVGDKIFAVDGIKALGSNETKIYEKLIYNGTDPVVYTIKNNDETETREVSLVADVVKINLIESELLDNGVGYVDLDGLVNGSTQQIGTQIDELINKGATSLVLDLRSVYSDNLEEVQKLCDLFLDEQVVFSVKHKDGTVTPYKTEDGKYDLPLAVLTGTYTEGVLEAFPAAIQALDRGVLVGEETAGNGTTQVRVPLEDGSGLSITTGLVLDAKGNQIKDNGVVPSVVQKTITENSLELVTTGTLKLENDVILQKAIEVLK